MQGGDEGRRIGREGVLCWRLWACVRDGVLFSWGLAVVPRAALLPVRVPDCVCLPTYLPTAWVSCAAPRRAGGPRRQAADLPVVAVSMCSGVASCARAIQQPPPAGQRLCSTTQARRSRPPRRVPWTPRTPPPHTFSAPSTCPHMPPPPLPASRTPRSLPHTAHPPAPRPPPGHLATPLWQPSPLARRLSPPPSVLSHHRHPISWSHPPLPLSTPLPCPSRPPESVKRRTLTCPPLPLPRHGPSQTAGSARTHPPPT